MTAPALRLALYVDLLAWLANQVQTVIQLETQLALATADNQRLKGGGRG